MGNKVIYKTYKQKCSELVKNQEKRKYLESFDPTEKIMDVQLEDLLNKMIKEYKFKFPNNSTKTFLKDDIREVVEMFVDKHYWRFEDKFLVWTAGIRFPEKFKNHKLYDRFKGCLVVIDTRSKDLKKIESEVVA